MNEIKKKRGAPKGSRNAAKSGRGVQYFSTKDYETTETARVVYNLLFGHPVESDLVLTGWMRGVEKDLFEKFLDEELKKPEQTYKEYEADDAYNPD